MKSTERRRRAALACLIATCVALTPGCLMGSPVAAFSGEPYGMTRDDVSAIGGRNGCIWSGAPVFAALDLPLAAALDTALLPFALIMWGLISLSGGGEDDGRGGADDDARPRHQGSSYTDDVHRSDAESSQSHWNDRATE